MFGDRFLSVPFERFCTDPKGVVERVYAVAGCPAPEFDLSRVRPAKPAFRADDARWRRLFEQVGIAASPAIGP